MTLVAPFPYFGGKRDIAADIWARFGSPRQYIEPFAGSLAVMLAKPGGPASLEVVGDANGFIANFWRSVRHQPEAVARAADYPVLHIDQGARHVWLMAQRQMLSESLHDPDWPGDAKVAGWWLWGQCSWIGSGWCDWWRDKPLPSIGQVPRADAGRGVQALGRVPHVSDAGMGVQALGQVPYVSSAGQGVQALGKIPKCDDAYVGINAISRADTSGPDGYLTSAGRAAHVWLHKLAARLERVRVIHGSWDRCLNHHYGGNSTAVVLDPPYRGYEDVYGDTGAIADQVAAWAREHQHLRIALCGHTGEHEMRGWTVHTWERSSNTYAGTGTKDQECIWFSPACIKVEDRQPDLFAEVTP
jgi:DNA adenine methylase